MDIYYPLGSHSVEWDGKDNKGISVVSGTYLVRMQVGKFVTVKKMLLLKCILKTVID
jgi:flagellar hook assembly protein FlgD